MRNLFEKSLAFIKENPSLLYSLVLVLLVPLAFFTNTYLINSSYEKAIDKITYRKAILVEDIINSLLQKDLLDDQILQESINRIAQKDTEIVALSVSRLQDQPGSFQIIASSKPELIGQIQNGNIQNAIAWNRPTEELVFLDEQDGRRFWNVTKVLKNDADEKIGLIVMAFSLEYSDALISATIQRSYWILIITVLIVLLFVSNQARLFGYALTVSKLKEIDKMKDMFISMASHELRSPLTAIKGYIDLLKDKKEISADEESKHYLTNISASVNRLTDLISDMLEVSRIEGNRIPMEITTVDAQKTIAESIEEISPQASQKGLALSFTPLENCPQIKADISRLKQVLINLIGNSIKYTPSGSVTVNTEVRGKELLVIIADTGIGISAEDQANLFKKFNRIQNEKTKNIIGTGLGLWITMEIIKKMDGNITVESIEGVGSHFMIHLPVAK
jgi:signal transduction histidine kinase